MSPARTFLRALLPWLAVWLLCAALAALLGSLLPLRAAAPVPPPPRTLAPADLVGRWRYAYGSHADGVIWLFPDGTYSAHHQAGGTVYVGEWWCDGWALELRESSYTPGLGRSGGPHPYRFAFRPGPAGGPLCGDCAGVPVRLSGRRAIGE